MNTLLAILKVTDARRDVILAGGVYHRVRWRHLPPLLHYSLPFHANDCVFSRNEQQKVYTVSADHEIRAVDSQSGLRILLKLWLTLLSCWSFLISFFLTISYLFIYLLIYLFQNRGLCFIHSIYNAYMYLLLTFSVSRTRTAPGN